MFCSLIYNVFQDYCIKNYKTFQNNEFHLSREEQVKRRTDVLYFDNGNPKKDKIEEYKLKGPTDETPIFRDLILKEDFYTAYEMTPVMNKFTAQIKRLIDELSKYGIEFYKETKEKKEIAEEDIKKTERDERIVEYAKRIEICKTVTRAENKKKRKKKPELEYEEVEVEEEIEIEVPDEDDNGPKIRTEIGPNGEIIEVIEEEVEDDF